MCSMMNSFRPVTGYRSMRDRALSRDSIREHCRLDTRGDSLG